MTGILGNSILITGIVISMMLMIELLNTGSKGRFFEKFRKAGFRQILFSSLLGCIPGCLGGFAAVSLYSRGMLTLGALTAMMIASSGDEAFVMLAMFPGKALILTATLFAIAVVSGIIIDRIRPGWTIRGTDGTIDEEYPNHCIGDEESSVKKTWGFKRIGLLAGFLVFISVLISGLGHSHGEMETGNINILSEGWMNAVFGILAIFLVLSAIFGKDNIIDLQMHIVRKHAIPIFLWTAGALAFVHLTMQYVDIASWISGNIPLMILLASLIGIIPESGPNLIFVTLFASGNIPFSVLMANSISQDGHSSIPLLAENKKSFVVTKLLNTLIALACGYAAYGLEQWLS